MRQLEKHRRAGVLAAAVAAGVLGALVAPAAADVTVSPPSAAAGQRREPDLHASPTPRTSAITTVKLVLPADTPVAEVYPLSVDDWAPQIDTRS